VTIPSFSLRLAALLATAVVVGVGLVAALLQVSSGAAKAATFSPYVDETGKISLPAGYRSQWAHLGTWAVREMMGGLSYHEVYTQPSSVEAYQQTGVFPDGAVLVKELRKTTAECGGIERPRWRLFSPRTRHDCVGPHLRSPSRRRGRDIPGAVDDRYGHASRC
jgi:Cytochrome P460